jgi:hypothetical protein
MQKTVEAGFSSSFKKRNSKIRNRVKYMASIYTLSIYMASIPTAKFEIWE